MSAKADASKATVEDAAKLAVEGDLDFKALGFMCGLEIHQQLDTRKLFSPCPGEVVDPDEVKARAYARFDRRLRATQSEMGESDPAVLAEAKRRRAFRYLAIEGPTSLVELDEEPPHPMDEEALDTTLTLTGLVGGHPADEVHVMRKTVIDGSNTSGFQRTALVATGGTIDADGGDVPVWTIAIEEDSARKLEEQDGLVTYTLDRLGIPLIELATGPAIQDPQHAKATAARIGALLRATGKVKRGLGSIRQDLNVSIAVGDRVEIKGCQDLRAVPRVIEGEVRRQLWMHHVAQELAARGFEAAGVADPVDVTDCFAETDAKLVRGAVKKGAKVLALVLPKWAGLIAGAAKDAPRYGREFADHAKVAAGVKGVFHSDELPAYGISESEVAAIREATKLGDEDAFVLCVEKQDTATRALEAVADRARVAATPQKEVRAAQPDDSTRYMRPLPGAARMYPETDVPPVRITRSHFSAICDNLPERPEEKVARFEKDHGISKDLAVQLVADAEDAAFEELVAKGGEPKLAARVLLQILPTLEHAERVHDHVPAVFAELAAGKFAKEAVPDILAALDKDAKLDVAGAIAAAGAEAADEGAVLDIVRKVVAERVDFVKERGMGAMGPLMGPVMAELRGKADGKVVSDALKAAIQEHL